MTAMKRVPDSSPQGFRMTSRDVDILAAVYRYRVLSTVQVERLLFPPSGGQSHRTKTSRCRHRLKMLFQLGYLHRVEQPTRLSEGRKPLLHLLDKKAVPILADELGVFVEEIDWKPSDNRIGWQFIEHTLAINDFRIAIDLAADQNRFQVSTWLDEKTLKRKEMKERVHITGPDGASQYVTVVPDGYFRLTADGYDYDRFVEIDLGTETGRSSKFGRRTFLRKLRGYAAFYRSDNYEKKYGTDAIGVLTVTTSKRRLANLIDLVPDADEEGSDMFWFTTLDRISARTVLTEPIWEIAGKKGKHSLVWPDQ